MRRRLLPLGLVLLVVALLGVAPPATAARRPEPKGWTLAGQRCRLVPVAAPIGAVESCPGIRPGASVTTPIGRCTLNFMWKGSDGAIYMGTAGHCLLEGTDTTEAAFRPGAGPVAGDIGRHPVGRFAYAVLDDVSDFALIRLDPAAAATASPQVCHFGGPTGLDSGPIPALTPLSQVGQGQTLGRLLPARTELSVDSQGLLAVESLGLASPGDSGSPVLNGGRATALVVATGPALGDIGLTGVVLSTRLAPQLARATAATGVRYTLQTAPRL